MIRDRVRELTDLARRLSADIDQLEGEKVVLREELHGLKWKAHQRQERSEPGSRRISEDCKVCVYRVEMLKRLDKGGESDKM